MTEWAFVRTSQWSINSDEHPAVATRVCQFLGADDPVQVIKPATDSFGPGKATLDWINDRVRLTLDPNRSAWSSIH